MYIGSYSVQIASFLVIANNNNLCMESLAFDDFFETLNLFRLLLDPKKEIIHIYFRIKITLS